MNVKLLAKTAGMSIKKHAPEIMMVTGAGLITAGVVFACVKSTKLKETTEKISTDFGAIKEASKDENYSKDDKRKDICRASLNAGKELAKLYWLPTVLLAGGMVCMIGANSIYRKRLLIATATAEALQVSFNNYRERVREELGVEADKKYLYGYSETVKKIREINEETGEVTEKEVTVLEPKDGVWCKLFDEINAPGAWRRFNGYNYDHIMRVQCEANNRLQRNNYLYLKDVLKMIGFEEPVLIVNGVDVSSTYGWVHCKDRQDVVDFGIWNYEGRTDEEVRQLTNFQTGDESNVWLEFNVSGDITKLVPSLMWKEAIRRDYLPWEGPEVF